MLKPHERYVFKPFSGSSHSWAIEQLKTVPKDTSVLDIGAGQGAMAEVLRENEVSELYAVEIDKDTREHITPLYKSVFSSIDEVKLNQQVDVVLLLDVLEHTADPLGFLKKSVLHLKSGGVVLISVPNIAHWSVRLQLLFGYFNYTSRGILDRTHLHFFTRNSIIKTVKATNELTVTSTSSTIVPLELLVSSGISESLTFNGFAKFRYRMAQILPGLLGYQTLVKAIKR